MSLVGFLAVALALAISLVPVWLLRRPDTGRLQDEVVGSQPTPPAVVRNASIAYALRMAAFGPLFAWGASGDLWPAIIGAASLALGVHLAYRLRLPLLVFLHDALRRDRPISVHAFIARHHGDDPRIRRLAASLTLFALLGLLVAEALGLAVMLEPLLTDSAGAVYALASGALLLTVLPAILAGHSGVMHSAQLQLGLLYLGLFGATALLLYLHLSALTPLPPHGTFAIVLAAVCCAALLWYRRSKYVDTEPIGAGRSGPRIAGRAAAQQAREDPQSLPLDPGRAGDRHRGCGDLCRGLPDIARQSAAALSAGTRVPGLGLLALCLLPLFYPLVDVAHWQRLAALAKGLDARGAEPGRRAAAVRGVFAICAAESALVWLFLCLLGAIAVTVIGTPEGTDALQGFVSRLVAADDGATVGRPAAVADLRIRGRALDDERALRGGPVHDPLRPAGGGSARASNATRPRRQRGIRPRVRRGVRPRRCNVGDPLRERRLPRAGARGRVCATVARAARPRADRGPQARRRHGESRVGPRNPRCRRRRWRGRRGRLLRHPGRSVAVGRGPGLPRSGLRAVRRRATLARGQSE